MHKTTHHRLIARSRHWLHLERLELRTLLSVNFGDPQVIMQPELDGPESVFAVDLDGDKDLDLLTATRFDNRVAWYENTGGAESLGPQRVISTAGTRADVGRRTYPADLDGDGDLDVLHAIREVNAEDDRVVWYENVDGTGNFGSPQVIVALVQRPNVYAADLDGDGDVDVLSSSWEDDTVAWHENTDGAGTFGPARLITTSVDKADSVLAEDLDGDRDLDILSVSRRDSSIVWFKNIDGQGSFERQVVTTNARAITSTIAVDMDRDGDLDVLAAGLVGAADNGAIVWYENTDGTGNFSPQRVIDETADNPFFSTVHHIRAADVDHDGDLDVLAVGADYVAWYEYLGGGTFGDKRVITREGVVFGGLSSGGFVDAADVDTDGDLDVVFTSVGGDKLAWHENIDGAGTFGPQQHVGSGVGSPRSTRTADVDTDGDLDIVYVSDRGGPIVWHENTDGLGTYGPPRVIARDTGSNANLHTADLDGDGDLDLILSFAICCGPWESTIVWYENTDGLGAYAAPSVITQEVALSLTISTDDVDGDGDLDVLSGKIAWYQNTDGEGTFGIRHPINEDLDGFWASAADLDGDRDLDVVAREDEKLTWYENTDGLGTYGPQRVITQGWWNLSGTADLDGDGDLDVVASWRETVAWFENEDGEGVFGPLRVISQGDVGVMSSSVAAADLDNDGDLDVISAWRKDGTATITFHENTDGAGTFGPQLVIATYSGSSFGILLANDVDTDGDLDVIAASSHGIVWYENLLAHPGDANRDGRFDSTDLVEVFQAGEYEDDMEDNSTWEEGDWNGDGDFDSGDLVEAFQKGLYERKSRTPASAIAAAVDWLFAEEESIRRSRAFVT